MTFRTLHVYINTLYLQVTYYYVRFRQMYGYENNLCIVCYYIVCFASVYYCRCKALFVFVLFVDTKNNNDSTEP